VTLEPVPWLEDEPDWFEDELFDEADPLDADESSEEESSDRPEFDESSEDELPLLLEFACCAALLVVVVLPR
jgi:hypothetical protein